MRRLGLVLSFLACAAAAPAAASEQSQALSARGLIALNAGDTQQALELFDRAVAADPNDAVARYQRGATRAKLGQYTGAVADLEAALALQPDFPQAQLELGVALTELREYAAAERHLLSAQQRPALDAQASFFLGIVQLRLGRLDDAARNFARARQADPALTQSAQYYEGVIAYRQHDYAAAEDRFAAVAAAAPTSAVGRESVRFLEHMRQARRARYSVFGTLGFEYDSNVTLAPDTATGVTGEGDGRFVINAGGRWVPLTYGPASLALSYEFFQSLQFELTDFNLQDHRPAAQVLLDFDPVLIGVLGRYDYYLLSTSSFLQEGTGFPWVTVREHGIGHTDFYVRVQYRDYKLHTIDDEPAPPDSMAAAPGFTVLNGFYNFAGVRQVISPWGGDRQIWLGYQLGFTDPDNGGIDAFQYTSYQLEFALRWPLVYSIIGEAGYRWERQDYDPASAVFNASGERRIDDDHRVLVSFERPLAEIWDHLFVRASWFGTFNESNTEVFQYDRQIGSIAAEVRF